MSKINEVLQDGMQPIETPESHLEQLLIEKYLAAKGYTMHQLETLPPDEAKHLLTEACQHAALRLAEIETTTTMWSEIEA